MDEITTYNVPKKQLHFWSQLLVVYHLHKAYHCCSTTVTTNEVTTTCTATTIQDTTLSTTTFIQATQYKYHQPRTLHIRISLSSSYSEMKTCSLEQRMAFDFLILYIKTQDSVTQS